MVRTACATIIISALIYHDHFQNTQIQAFQISPPKKSASMLSLRRRTPNKLNIMLSSCNVPQCSIIRKNRCSERTLRFTSLSRICSSKLYTVTSDDKAELTARSDSSSESTSQIMEEDPFLKYPKRVISASVSTKLPFSSTVAFEAFSDLTRQPSWSPWLRSVVYLDEIDDSDHAITDGSIPLRETEWTLRIRGINFSWRAISTKLERPNLIQWKSTSGIRNRGKVEFIETSKDESCEMAITMAFVMPRLLVKMFQNSGFVKRFFTNQMLGGMLERFRYIIMKEDLGITIDKEFEDVENLEEDLEGSFDDEKLHG